MSFDGAASPSITLRALAQGEEREVPYGWGFAWYPEQSPSALVVKDPSSTGENAMTKVLREWERFESTFFPCHLRGAARTLTEQDTHPFSRCYAGRDWVFAHNGDLTGDLATGLLLDDDGAFEPVGRTDSERAFRWLLSKLRAARARTLADAGGARVLCWLRELDALGTANFLLTDGADVVAYHDDERHNGLFYTRLLPPHEASLRGEDLEVDLGDAGERSRTVGLVSTVPLGGAGWTPMHGSQMTVLRRGALVFDSHADEAQRARIVAPVARESIARATAACVSLPGTAPWRTPEPDGPAGGRGEGAPAGSSSPFADAAQALPPLPDLRAIPRTRVLSVLHETRYRYARAVERSSHLFRLRPVHDPMQELVAYDLSISAEDLRREYEDVFGNATTRTEVERPYEELRILSRSVVRVHARPSGELTSPVRRFTLPLVWMPWQRQMMLPYLLPPELPETQLQELYEYAMSFVIRQDHDLVQTLLDIDTTIYRDYRYVSGSTTLATTPFDV
jgi:predicted glutamine amidotransferase